MFTHTINATPPQTIQKKTVKDKKGKSKNPTYVIEIDANNRGDLFNLQTFYDKSVKYFDGSELSAKKHLHEVIHGLLEVCKSPAFLFPLQKSVIPVNKLLGHVLPSK